MTFDISWHMTLTLRFLVIHTAYIQWTLDTGESPVNWELSENGQNGWRIPKTLSKSKILLDPHGWLVVGPTNVTSKKVEFLDTLRIQQWENLYFWVLIYHGLLLQAGADFALHIWKIISPPCYGSKTRLLTAVFLTNNLQSSEKKTGTPKNNMNRKTLYNQC